MKLCVVTQQILKSDVFSQKGTKCVVRTQIIKLGHNSENTTSLTRFHDLVTLLLHIPNNCHIFQWCFLIVDRWGCQQVVCLMIEMKRSIQVAVAQSCYMVKAHADNDSVVAKCVQDNLSNTGFNSSGNTSDFAVNTVHEVQFAGYEE